MCYHIKNRINTRTSHLALVRQQHEVDDIEIPNSKVFKLLLLLFFHCEEEITT